MTPDLDHPESGIKGPARTWVLFGGYVLAAFWMAWLQSDRQADDAMIVLRYARNLMEHGQWAYNLGESVQASTSPLNTLLLCLAWLGSGDWISAQVWVQGLGVGLASWLGFLLLRDRGWFPALFAGLCVLGIPLLDRTQGLETAPYLALLLATTWAFARERFALGSTFLGLLALTRPEGLLLAPLVFLPAWRRAKAQGNARPLLLRALLPCLAILITWSLFAWWQFGSPFPSTLGAKLAQRRSGLWGHGHIFWAGIKSSLPDILRWPLPPALYLVFFALAAWLSRRTRLWPLLAFALLQTLAYTILNPPFYHWYALPLHLAIALGAALLVARIWNLHKNEAGRRSWNRTFSVGLALLWLIAGFPDPLHRRPPYANTRTYRAAAAWLAERASPGRSLAAWEIGNLGFHLPDMRIVDIAGLVSPAGQEALAHGDVSWFVQVEKPDYVFFHDPPWPRMEAPTLRMPAFVTRYRLLVQRSDASGQGFSIYGKSP